MVNIENEEEIVKRGYNVIINNLEWVEYVKTFNNIEGFLWTNNDILIAIKDAIYLDNPDHSSSSLALTLIKCKDILNR